MLGWKEQPNLQLLLLQKVSEIAKQLTTYFWMVGWVERSETQQTL
jgi:hypothetical protein